MPTPLQPSPAGARAIGAKILLVDDDQELTEALALERAGFRPFRAASLPAALDMFDAERPDLALLDTNGLEVADYDREGGTLKVRGKMTGAATRRQSVLPSLFHLPYRGR